MGIRKFSTFVTADVTLTNAAETVIATLSGVSTNQPGQTVAFEGDCTIATGAGTTGVTLRVRQGSLTGSVIGEAVADTIEAAAGSTESHQITVASTSLGEFSGGAFVLTAEQVAGAANGTVSQCSLRCEVTP